MATRVPPSVPAAPGPAVQRWAAGRRAYLDNLKVAVIAGIIAIHAVLGYAGTLDAWSYTGVREVTLSPLPEIMLMVLIAPFGLFTMTLFFLVAGLLAGPSLRRKGPARFARDRLLRLGVPFLVYVLVVQPTMMYGLEHPLGVATGSFWYEYLGREGKLDTGPLWFVGVLLLFSLCYAGLVAARLPARVTGPPRAAGASGPARVVTARHLTLLAVLVVPASFLIRLVYPYGSEAGFTDLNLWQWPACLAVFGLGIVGSRQGWLAAVPDALAGRGRSVTLVALAAMAALLLGTGMLGLVDASFGGWKWPALLFAAVEAPLTVFGSVWLLAAAQHRLDRPARWAPPAVARAAYAAFIVQAPVLIGLALALRPLPLPAEVKALVVAGCGVAGSFGLGWLLATRVPGVRRIL